MAGSIPAIATLFYLNLLIIIIMKKHNPERKTFPNYERKLYHIKANPRLLSALDHIYRVCAKNNALGNNTCQDNFVKIVEQEHTIGRGLLMILHAMGIMHIRGANAGKYYSWTAAAPTEDMARRVREYVIKHYPYEGNRKKYKKRFIEKPIEKPIKKSTKRIKKPVKEPVVKEPVHIEIKRKQPIIIIVLLTIIIILMILNMVI